MWPWGLTWAQVGGASAGACPELSFLSGARDECVCVSAACASRNDSRPLTWPRPLVLLLPPLLSQSLGTQPIPLRRGCMQPRASLLPPFLPLVPQRGGSAAAGGEHVRGGAGGGVPAELVGRWLPPPPVAPPASPPPQPRLPVGRSSVDSQLSPSPRRLFRPGTGHREPGAEGPTRWSACALWAGPGRGGLGTERWLGCRTAASWSRCHELSAILRPGRPRWRPVVTQPGTPRAPPPSSGPFTFCRRVFPHPQPPKC